MSKRVSGYLEAIREYIAAREALCAIRERTLAFSRSLAGGRAFFVDISVNVVTGVVTHDESQDAAVPKIDFDTATWPSGADVSAAISRFRDAFIVATERWNAVDEDDRAALLPPPSSLLGI